MNKYIIKGSPEEIDKLLIPNAIYNLTINKKTKELIKYFIVNPSLGIKFVGFYSQLKITNRLASDRKCNCFYKVPWLTKYAYDNKIEKTILLYGQQLEEYRYIIRYNYPSPQQSYMKYLIDIIFPMLYDVKRFKYNQDNNLDTNAIYHIYFPYFKNYYQFEIWINYTTKLLLSK